jgi:ABC-type uncharacterized transport system substrate-binding protein
MVMTIRSGGRLAAVTLLALSGITLSGAGARAHPHVWVTYQTVIDCDKGTITGVDHVWTFDEMYTTMAIEGLDKNNDGKYDRDELAELAKINMEGLKDFDYFTFAKIGSEAVKFSGPSDAWLEHTNGILTLHYHLALAAPVPIATHGISFAIYDPSFFIAFDPAKTEPVKLAGAPQGCTVTLLDPQGNRTLDDAKKLDDPAIQQLSENANFGFGLAKTIVLSCKTPG